LGIHRKHWRVAVERTVLASVRAFHFLHKVRFGGLSETKRPDLGSERSDAVSSDSAEGGGLKRKPRRHEAGEAQNCTDSDSSTVDDLTEQPRPSSRARRTQAPRPTTTAAADRLLIAHSANATDPRQTSPRAHRASTLSRVHGGKSKRRTRKADMARAHIVTVAERDSMLSVSGRPHRLCRQQQLKRKRCGRASIASVFDTDDPDHRPIQRHRHAPADPPDLKTLWTHWRRMEPRKRRRT
jgi:hypothetical protein